MSNFAMASVSLAHTYGNMTTYMVDFIKSWFPKDFFNTVHVSSKIAFKEFNILQNTNRDFFKKSKPMLIIRPRIDINGNDNFLRDTFLTSRLTDGFMDVDFNNLQPFMFDKYSKYKITYLMNRIKMLFDVSIVVDSHMQQINLANYIKNRVRIDIPFMLTVNFENNVERVFFEAISKQTGIPMYDENGSISNFLEYLGKVSAYPITYKLKNSTGNDEFFRFYKANVDTLITNFDMDEGSKKGFVDNTFTITFTAETEFFTAGMYYFMCKDKSTIDFINERVVETVEKDCIIPIFTYQTGIGYDIPLGWDLYTCPVYGTENKTEVLELDPIFNDSIRYVIRYHKEHGVKNNVFLDFKVTKDNELLENGKDYTIDYDNLLLTTFNTSKQSTYRLFCYVHITYLNNLISDMNEFNKEK